MKLGAEPKKIVILGGLVLVAIYLLYTNFAPGSSGASSPRPSALRSAIPEQAPVVKYSATRPAAPKRSDQEFRLSFKPKGVDPGTIDPKLRLDLLAKVRSVDLGPAARNLFVWGPAPPPQLADGVKEPGKIMPRAPVPGAQGPNAVDASASSAPPPPPITLKYYGYTSQRADGHKRAFFSEGDCTGNTPNAQCDIFIAAEGDLILKRYKVVRITNSSADVEDTQFKHTQPLPITQESPS